MVHYSTPCGIAEEAVFVVDCKAVKMIDAFLILKKVCNSQRTSTQQFIFTVLYTYSGTS